MERSEERSSERSENKNLEKYTSSKNFNYKNPKKKIIKFYNKLKHCSEQQQQQNQT